MKQRNFQFFLPPEILYELTIFDSATGLVGRETGITSPSGQRTNLASTMVFEASVGADTDADGLPDDVEHAIVDQCHTIRQ